jgi:hypothetical protein
MAETNPTSFERQLRGDPANAADRLGISTGLTDHAHARIAQRNKHRRVGGIATLVAIAVITGAIIVPRVAQSHSSVPTTLPKTPPIGTRLSELKVPGGFGGSMAISGNTIVLGGADRANVFTKTATGWTQTSELKVANSSIGTSVAISGDTIVAGSVGHKVVYVFTKTATGWTQTSELKTANAVASVATSGTTVVVAEGYGGTPYVFTKTAAGWTQVAELNDFGPYIAISGTTAFISGYGGAGVFTKTATGWRQVAELRLAAGDFVDSLAISDTTAVIGAYTRRPQSLGHTYVFAKTATGWRRVARVAELKGAGGGVAISGTTFVEGAPTAANGTGRAYVFTKTATGWRQVAELKGSDTNDDRYSIGQQVAISGTTAIVSGNGPVAYVFQS